MRPRFRQLALVLLCVAATWFWWDRRVESPMRAPRVSAEALDDYAYYYPMFRYAFEEARQGRFPLWNPYQHCGSPFFATAQHLLLYPLNTLFLLLPTSAAMKGTNILHLCLAILFTYFLARTIGLRPPAALTAGLVFAFSPVLTNSIYAPHHLYGAVWMPLHLALLHRVLQGQRKLWPATLLGAAVAAQYLGGYPMFSLFSAYLMGLYAFWFTASHWRTLSGRDLARSAGALATAGVLAALLALPQLLPALELAQLSPRPARGLTMRMVDSSYSPGWLQPLQTLAGALLPTLNSVFSSGSAPHVGMVALALAGLGIAFPQRRSTALFFAVVALGSALIGLGRHTPLFGLYFMLPTSNWFRLTTRFFALTAFALAMLAGIGVDALSRERVGRKFLLGLLFACLAIASALAVLLYVGGASVATVGDSFKGGASMPGATTFVGRLALLCGYLLGGAAWLAAYIWGPRARRVLVAALPVAAYGSLFVSFLNYAPLPDTHPDLHTLPPPVAEYLRARQGLQRVYIIPWGTFVASSWLPPRNTTKPAPPSPVPTKAGMMDRLFVVDDSENVYPVRITEYAARMIRAEDTERMERLLASFGIPNDEGVPQGNFNVRADAPNLRLLDLFGTRFIVEGFQTSFEQQEAPERFPLVYASDGVKVYENTAAYPRAFVVGQAEIVSEPRRVLDRLTNPDFDPRTSVILEEQPARLPPAGSAAARSDVQFETYATRQVVLRVHTDAPGFLVLTDTYYPGWTAEIDAARAPIYRADYLYRAVFIDAGDHRVVFRYEPSSFRWGLLGGAAGLALLALGLLKGRRRGRW